MARLVTQGDIDTYGAAITANGQTPMQLNDVIYFLSDKTPSGNLYKKDSWTGARLGATVWIQAGEYRSIDIGIESSTGGKFVPSDYDNPAHIHFFGGQGVIKRNLASLGGREFQIYNVDSLIVDFESHAYPGLRDGWGSGRTGTFGAIIKNEYMTESGMGLKIDNKNHTQVRLEIRGAELTMGSFAKIRAMLSENHLDRFIIERNLINRSVGGEGIYIGQTSALAGEGYNTLKNFHVRDNIFAFTAAEGMQMQQIADGTRIHNNVMYIAAHDYRSAFQAFQDTGIQMEFAQGDVCFYDNVIIGFGTTGMHLMSRNLSLQGIDYGQGITKIYNNAILGGKIGHSFRVHDGFRYGRNVLVRGNDFVMSVRDYYDDVAPLKDYHIDISRNDVPISFIANKFPDDGYQLLKPGTNSSVRNFENTRETQDLPEFVNDGFTNIDIHQITRWSPLYHCGQYAGDADTDATGNDIDPSTLVDGGDVTMTLNANNLGFTAGQKVRVVYRSSPAKGFYAEVVSYSGYTLNLTNISNRWGSGPAEANKWWDVDAFLPYQVGEFVWLAAEDENVPMDLYKCIAAHEPVPGALNTYRPDLAPTQWEKVWWDANGKNMYDPAYNGTPFTTDFMEVAGDFRLVKGSYHHLKGRGLSCNEQRDDCTMMGWEWKTTVLGTAREIPGAYKPTLDVDRYSYLKSGRYVRYWVQRMNGNGVLEAEKNYTDWSIIP